MIILKKLFISAGLIAVCAISASAHDFTIKDNLGNGNFSYVGQGSWKDRLWDKKFEVYKMGITRENGLLKVKIKTNFADINNQWYNGGDYLMGDLFMSTTGWKPNSTVANDPMNKYDNAFNTGTKWDYVYDMNTARGITGNQMSWDGRLRKLNDYDMNTAAGRNNFEYGSERRNGYSQNDPRAVRHLYKVKDGVGAYTTVNEDKLHDVAISSRYNYLEFIFDVTGTELETAKHIAFGWADSGAKDIIQGEVWFGGRDVPAPAALGLLLLGLTFVGHKRRRKQMI